MAGPPDKPVFSGESVWPYTPSFPTAITAVALHGIVTVYLGYLTLIRYRTWYFSWAVLGGVFETAGFSLRCYSIQNQSKLVYVSPFLRPAFPPSIAIPN